MPDFESFRGPSNENFPQTYQKVVEELLRKSETIGNNLITQDLIERIERGEVPLQEQNTRFARLQHSVFTILMLLRKSEPETATSIPRDDWQGYINILRDYAKISPEEIDSAGEDEDEDDV